MGISIRAYAQHRGVSHEAVRKAIATGRIQQEADGSIDPDKADAAWDRNTLARGDGEGGDARSGVPNLQTSRAIREAYAARLAKLDFEERTGKLISADQVKVETFNLARRLRDRIQQLPRRVAPQIVAAVVKQPDVREVEALLDAEIHEALSELVR